MMQNKKSSSGWPMRVMGILASTRFFWVTVGLFVVGATWIAFSGRYPMAFDEDFHLGVIRLYAHHLSPFWSHQPENADRFGAVARDPSYFYHYLLSFPYRLISALTTDQTVQVIWLRLINIGLFASGLVVYRRLLLLSGASRAVVHSCLAVFSLLPVISLVAAQINYDNLLFPLTGLSLILAVRLSSSLDNKQPIDIQALLLFLSCCFIASIVKYAFLPIFLAEVVYLVLVAFRRYTNVAAVLAGLRRGISRLSALRRVVLVLLLVASLGLFLQRDGINMVRYHTPVPDCSKVLDAESCKDYGPWIRDHNLSIAKFDAPRSPAVFTADWLYGMWLRLFFTVDGPATQFQSRGPLLLPALIGMAVPLLGLLAVTSRGRQLFRRYDGAVLGLLLSVSMVYIATLWIDEYRAFLRTGQPVAINGRYLLPVLPLLFLFVVVAFAQWLKKPALRMGFAGLITGCLLAGGGSLTYILRSNNDWYWPNQTVRDVNHGIQDSLGRIIPGYYTPTSFLR